MKIQTIPSVTFLKECFDYYPLTGMLFWRSRPLLHFATTASHQTWNKRYAGTMAGRAQSSGHIQVHVEGRRVMAHRVIWTMMTGVDPHPMEIDHTDLNHSNNRWANMRLATGQQNMWNKAVLTKSKSGFKGVHPWGRKFTARIMLNGKNTYLGLFDTPQEAHQAYCDAAKARHGAFFHP